MLYIIDSYAWVEYFTGSEIGKKLKKLLGKLENRFITVECCLAELKGWSIKNNINFQELLRIIETNSAITPILRDEWIQAAVIKSNLSRRIKDFGLIDAILVAQQRNLNCKIITADRHFKGLKGIEFLK